MTHKIHLILFSLLMYSVVAVAGEATSTSTTGAYTGSYGVFDDRSCPSGSQYSNMCCYKGNRYDCTYLNNQFLAGYCLKPNGIVETWQKNCDLGIPRIQRQTARSVPAPTRAKPAALPYAADLTSCARTGERAARAYARSRGKRSGAGYCAVGVRNALDCMWKKTQGFDPNIKCGGSAYDYYGKGCLESKGFVRDMNACDTPGVVRVYYGYRHKNRSYSGGDRHGHIEFLGTDGLWHAGVANSNPIDDILGHGRRILKACYVLKGAQ